MYERGGRSYRFAALTVLLVLTLAPLGGAAGRAPLPLGTLHPASGLTLSGTPTSGVAPLVVAFRVTGPNGTTPSAVAWSFGDGGYLNGSGATDSSVSHEYDAPGTFSCQVTAVYPYGTLNASLPIDVRASTLNVTISATPRNGSAPLTVQFNATPTGGSGTYVEELWEFGDNQTGTGAGLEYTYAGPGTFVANFSVTDSTNHTARASVSISVANATAVVKPRPSDGENNSTAGVSGLWTDVAVGGAGAAVVGFLGVLLWSRRSREALERLPGPPVSPPEVAPTTGPPHPAEEAPADPDPSPPAPSGLPGAQRLTFQILRHLVSLPRLGPSDLPTAAWTQAGIAAAVDADQSAVSRILRRLAATGVLTVETTHVAGGARRLRVYRLTGKGERLGRALRESEAPAFEPDRSPPPDSA